LIEVGIVGGTGYAGVELLRLLAGHPDARLRVITSRGAAGTPVSSLFPNLRGVVDAVFREPDVAELAKCDVVFFAAPNGTAMAMAPELLAAGSRVIDLGADFRLQDLAVWSRWYGVEHSCPELLGEAVYGLPECHREAIRQARLVANPGCHATAVQLGLLALVESGGFDHQTLIASALSGVSGAGRQPKQHTLFGEAGENVHAYGAGGHRHRPEIEAGLSQAAGNSVQVAFVPHLVPMIRGIHASLYAYPTGAGVDAQACMERRFAGEPFVDVMPGGSLPETRSVRGSNMCRLAVYPGGEAEPTLVLSVIDNLVKGASGQAVHNMNLMFGYPENQGLVLTPALP